MEMPITQQLIEAIEFSADALNQRSDDIEKLPEFTHENGVGDALRKSVECSRQQAAIVYDCGNIYVTNPNKRIVPRFNRSASRWLHGPFGTGSRLSLSRPYRSRTFSYAKT